MINLIQLQKKYYTISEAVSLINQKSQEKITEDHILQAAKARKFTLFTPISVEYGLFDIDIHIFLNNQNSFNSLIKSNPFQFNFGYGYAINRYKKVYRKSFLKKNERDLSISYRVLLLNGLLGISIGEAFRLGDLKYDNESTIRLPDYSGNFVLCEKLSIDEEDYSPHLKYIITYIIKKHKRKQDHFLNIPMSSLVLNHEQLSNFIGCDNLVPISNGLLSDKKINIQGWERALNEILLKEHYASYLSSSSSTNLANHLNFLAEKHRKPYSFDDSTISRFIKKINSSE